MSESGGRLRVLTWHVHGGYLQYLAQGDYDIFLPVKRRRVDGYWGKLPAFDWPASVHEVPAEEVRDMSFDVVLYQHRRNWLHDQYEILSRSQRVGPRVYLEHDPPLNHPADSAHIVDDPNVLLVHVTHFNDLMWNCGDTPTRVITHGVPDLGEGRYTGERERGLTVVNNLYRRGRRLGPDVFDRARAEVPLDLLGMHSEDGDGAGEVALRDLPNVAGGYRFFFNPIRYTSLGLAVCEAMMLGMPVVGLATTEMATAIENGRSGFVDTDVTKLIDYMRLLLLEPAFARHMGIVARQTAKEQFSIERFRAQWKQAFQDVVGRQGIRAVQWAGEGAA